jgi:hypothetical protein
MDYEQYPERKLEEIRLLWDSDYWDGPLSGLLLLDGRKYWYQMVEEGSEPYTEFYRRFAIVELTGEQLAEEEKWHRLFQEKVGRHTDYDAAGKRNLGSVLPQRTWNEFYDAFKQWQQPNYLENRIVGWFKM